MPDNTLREEMREALEELCLAHDDLEYNQAVTGILSAIKNRLPKEWDEGDGWDMFFSEEKRCCPGDDIAFARNHTLHDVRQALDIESEGASK